MYNTNLLVDAGTLFVSPQSGPSCSLKAPGEAVVVSVTLHCVNVELNVLPAKEGNTSHSSDIEHGYGRGSDQAWERGIVACRRV